MARDFVSHKAKPTAPRPGSRPIKPVPAAAPEQTKATPANDKAAKTGGATKPAGKVDPADPKTWPKEVGGPEGPEPTRYGDWERKGICSDF